MKYAWITEHRDLFPIAVMCKVLEVSSSGYYDSIDRPPSAKAERHERIKQAVVQVHARFARPSPTDGPDATRRSRTATAERLVSRTWRSIP